MNGIGIGNSGTARDHRSTAVWDAAHDLPGMLGASAEQGGPLPQRDVQTGRRGLELLALRAFGRGVL